MKYTSSCAPPTKPLTLSAASFSWTGGRSESRDVVGFARCRS